MEFSKFNGEIRRYPQFKEEFTKHVATMYRDEQLAFVLKSYLTKEVREEVESCGEDYDAIWLRLDQRFGDRGRLVNKILDEVTHLSQEKDNDAVTLQMIKVVERAYRDLKRLNAEEEMYNATMIVTIEKKMASAMKQEWAKEVAGKDLSSKTKFLTLLECLQNWRCRIEYIADDVRSSTPLESETKGKLFYQQNSAQNATMVSDQVQHEQDGKSNTSSGGTQPREKCWIHGLDHPVWRCKEFLGQGVEERLNLVEHYKVCRICLHTTCPGVTSSSECRSMNQFKCNLEGCGELRNRLLHVFKKVSGSSAHSDGGSAGAATGTAVLMTQ